MVAARKRLGEMLIDAGVIDATQLQAALGHQRRWGCRIGQALVDLRLATEAQVVDALAEKFGFEAARLDALEPHALSQALALVPRDVAVKNSLFPMAADTSTLTVAMSDPANVAVVDELQFRTSRRVRVCIGGDREIAEAIRRHYSRGRDAEAIPIELDADEGGAGTFMEDPVGGGSHDALEAFFGQAAEPPTTALPAGPARDPSPTPRPPPPRSAPAGEAAQGTRYELDLEERTGVRAQLLGTVPHGGLGEGRAQEAPPADEPEELTPLPLPAGEPILATELAPPAPAAPGESRALEPREAALLDALFRLGRGDDAAPTVAKPEQLVAALLRILLEKGIVTEQELVDQLLGR